MLALAHAYDPTYKATVATVIPFVFIAIVVDLGLAKRSATPLAAGILLSIVIVLLASELLCLNALSLHRELTTDQSPLVAGAVLFSGTVVLYRVSEPLIKTTVTDPVGRWMVRLLVGFFILLVVLHGARVVSGDTAVVAFASWTLILGVILPGIVGGSRTSALGQHLRKPEARSTLRPTPKLRLRAIPSRPTKVRLWHGAVPCA